MREDEHVAVDPEQLLDHPVGPLRELLDALAPERSVAPDRPVGNLLADLRRRQAVVLAVVPLGQVVAQLGLEARQPRGLPRPRQRARQHQRERRASAAPPPPPAPAARPPRSAAGRCDPCAAPSRLHSVSPCRTSSTSTRGTLVRLCQPPWEGGLTTAIRSRSTPRPCASWATARSTCSSSGSSAPSPRSGARRLPRCASASTARLPTQPSRSTRSSPGSTATCSRSRAGTAIRGSSASSPSPARGPARSAT